MGSRRLLPVRGAEEQQDAGNENTRTYHLVTIHPHSAVRALQSERAAWTPLVDAAKYNCGA
jgi:hypothetical protein